MKKDEEIVSIVPAQPGYAVYRIHDGEFVPPDPVVAFVIVKNRRSDGSFFLWNHPLTSETDGFMDENSQEYALKRPDGSFDFPCECVLANQKEAEAYIKQGKLRGVSSG